MLKNSNYYISFLPWPQSSFSDSIKGFSWSLLGNAGSDVIVKSYPDRCKCKFYIYVCLSEVPTVVSSHALIPYKPSCGVLVWLLREKNTHTQQRRLEYRVIYKRLITEWEMWSPELLSETEESIGPNPRPLRYFSFLRPKTRVPALVYYCAALQYVQFLIRLDFWAAECIALSQKGQPFL